VSAASLIGAGTEPLCDRSESTGDLDALARAGCAAGNHGATGEKPEPIENPFLGPPHVVARRRCECLAQHRLVT
jgi:hypothetical protein